MSPPRIALKIWSHETTPPAIPHRRRSVPARMPFARAWQGGDRQTCDHPDDNFPTSQLSRDHVHPSRGRCAVALFLFGCLICTVFLLTRLCGHGKHENSHHEHKRMTMSWWEQNKDSPHFVKPTWIWRLSKNNHSGWAPQKNEKVFPCICSIRIEFFGKKSRERERDMKASANSV